MICRLCLKDINDVIEIFGVVGLEVNVAMVLAKYFWFKPKNDDPISTVICTACWIKVSDFHEFYLSVEEAHHLLAERFSIKTEKKSELNPLVGIAVNSGKASTSGSEITIAEGKQETGLLEIGQQAKDEFEIEFSVFLADNNNEYVDEEQNIENNDGHDFVLNNQDHSAIQEAVTELEESIREPEFLGKVISFDEHFFVEKILDEAQELDDGTEKEEDKLNVSGEDPKVHVLRRSTRQNKFQLSETNSVTNFKRQRLRKVGKDNEKLTKNDEKTPKPRGRPRKSGNTLSNQAKNKAIDLQERRMKEIKSRADDEKIAGYMRLQCHVCAIEVPTFAKLRSHFTKTHQQTAYVICCNKKFYKRVLLVEHIDKHLDPECYKCIECDKIFSDKQCLRNHKLLKHQPDDLKKFECEHCPKKYAKSYLLEQHLIVHAARDHICDICQRGFPSAPQLVSHVKVAHSNAYGMMCHICAKLVRGRAAFERHQLEHAGVNIPKVQCEKCGSWHKNKYSLQKHRRRHNEEGKLHVCSICNKVAPNRSALLSHFRYVHAAERTYECSVCKKAFKKQLSLKEHMTMHTGEVLYSCPHCPKTFNSNANMHSHRKKMHPREFEEQRKLRRARIATDNEQQETQETNEGEISEKTEINFLETNLMEDHGAKTSIYTAS